MPKAPMNTERDDQATFEEGAEMPDGSDVNELEPGMMDANNELEQVATEEPHAEDAPPEPDLAPAKEVKYEQLGLLIGGKYRPLPPLTPITAEFAKQLLGWETEPQYAERKMLENPARVAAGLTPWTIANCQFVDSTEMPPSILQNRQKEKVVCWNSTLNRPFDEKIARKYSQSILTKQWAGPSSMVGKTVNGETIIIGVSGEVLSGQKRLAALILAAEDWHAQKEHWQAYWPEEPVLDALIVVGVSEDVEIVQTLDDVQPRSLEDEFYVSEEFRDLVPSQRRECSRMLKAAVELLWKRTDAESTNQWGTKQTKDGGWTQHLTHAVSKDFLKRHPRLNQCVREIFKLNGNRSLSLLKLSAGQCATCLYLMGSSESDVDAYRLLSPVPHERVLKWGRFREALQFWTSLAKAKEEGAEAEQHPVRLAFDALIDRDAQDLGLAAQKLVTLAKAWSMQCEDKEVTWGSLKLEWHEKRDGSRVLLGRHELLFGGIDCGQWGPPDLVDAPTPEEAAAAKAKEQEDKRRKQQEEDERKVAEMKAAAAKDKPPLDKLAEQAAANAGKGANGKALASVQGKPITAKQAQAAQTAKAKAADEALMVDKTHPPIPVPFERLPQNKRNGKGLAPGNAAQAAKNATAAPAANSANSTKPKRVMRGGTN